MALIMGGFIILNTFRTLVAERRRDIGMLRALGASRKTVLNLIVMESLVQGVLGTALGLVGGYLLVKAILVITGPILSMKLGFQVGEPSFSPLMVILSIALGIGVTLIGGLFPAISASRLTPLEALRPITAQVFLQTNRRRAWMGAVVIGLSFIGLLTGDVKLATLGAFGFLAGLTLLAPVLVHPISRIFGRLLGAIFAREGQIAEGNLSRQPGRAALTATVVMISLAIVVTMGAIVTTFTSSIFGYLDKTLGSDYLFMPDSLLLSGGNVGASPELAGKVAEIPGIEAVASLRLSSSQVGDASIQVLGIDPVNYPKVSGLVFSSGDSAEAYAAMADGRALIANGILAAQAGMKIGDEVTLETPDGPRAYRVVALGIDYLNAKLPTVYISQANLEQDFHETSDVLIMANLAQGADDASVRAGLESLAKDYPAFKLFSSQQLRADMAEAMNSSFSMIYLLMVVLAAPSLIALINTLAISVLERTREIGMLRAVGATRRQIQRMILAESLLLSAMGTAFGLLAGVWLGYVLVGAANAAGFVIAYDFPYTAIILTLAIGILLGVVAALIPARQAARLQIVSALQYE
jgi:putative ABC transport system permease protein